MSTRLVPKEASVQAARQFVESVTETANSVYYVWLGDHSTGTPGDIYDCTFDTIIEPYRNMTLGKRVGENDVSLMVRRVNYTTNTVYTMYDDSDPLIYEKDFYAVVNAGAYFHLFKCLDNVGGIASNSQPNFADVDPSDSFLQTSDGYLWKYIYSVNATLFEKFSTGTSYFPLMANTDVIDAATSGSIDVIAVDLPGAKYNNYIDGTFNSGDVRVNGNTVLYAISSANNVSAVSGYYTGCMLYLATGVGSGQYRIITDYISNANGRYVVIDSEFTTTPTNSTEWQIRPHVEIVGDGSQTINAVARALINAVGNTIHRVEMLVTGQDYRYASARVIANSVVGVTSNAAVRPIYGPPGGHGSDPAVELGATRVSVSMKFSNSEGGLIPANNSFRQIGVMRDPLFANVTLNLTNSAGVFITDETVYHFNSLRIKSNVSVTANSNQFSNTQAVFTEQLIAGDYVYIRSSDDLNHVIAIVNNVVNATHVNLTENVSWSCTDSIIYKATIESEARVTEIVDGTTIRITDLDGIVENGDQIIGVTSGSKSDISSIQRNGVVKGFDTFIQMHKYVGTYEAGSLTKNEKVYQGESVANSTANGMVHSTNTSGGITIYVSNQVGLFDSTQSLKGANSGALYTITSAYEPELVFGTGRNLYLENTIAVERQVDQTETVNIILDFNPVS